jgi:hypothetical protein
VKITVRTDEVIEALKFLARHLEREESQLMLQRLDFLLDRLSSSEENVDREVWDLVKKLRDIAREEVEPSLSAEARGAVLALKGALDRAIGLRALAATEHENSRNELFGSLSYLFGKPGAVATLGDLRLPHDSMEERMQRRVRGVWRLRDRDKGRQDDRSCPSIRARRIGSAAFVTNQVATTATPDFTDSSPLFPTELTEML